MKKVLITLLKLIVLVVLLGLFGYDETLAIQTDFTIFVIKLLSRYIE